MSIEPLGVFDSGLGGLSVVAEIVARLPNERMVYYADSGNCPYGPRPVEEICLLAAQATEFLLTHHAKLIVIACNTATSAAVAYLRARYSVPFVAMVPAVKPAAERSHGRRVGVLATQATLQTQTYSELVERFAHDITLCEVAGPELVELVECGELDGSRTESILRRVIDPMLAQGIDTLVLGCTHYPFLRPAIERVVGPSVEIIDTGAPVARQVARVLDRHNLAALHPFTGPRLHFYTTGDSTLVAPIARRLLALLGLEHDAAAMPVEGVGGCV